MPLAPALRGQSIRAQADVQLIGDHGEVEDVHSILLMTLSPYFQIVLSDKCITSSSAPGPTTSSSPSSTTTTSNNNSANNNNYIDTTIDSTRMITNNHSRCSLVRIIGADSETLKLIKEYAYEGKITGVNSENIEKVHRVADMYNIIGIINECELFYKKHQTSNVQTTKS